MFDRILDILWDYFRAPKRTPIRAMPEVSSAKLDSELLSLFTSNIWISDAKYVQVHTDDLKAFLALNPVSTRKYLLESQDCDDFSFEAQGDVCKWYNDEEQNSNGAFGIVWGFNAGGSAHAWNFFVNENNKVMFMEPQTDEIFSPGSEKVWIMIM